MANKLRTRLSAEGERTRFLQDTKGSRNNVADSKYANPLACRESQSASGLRLTTSFEATEGEMMRTPIQPRETPRRNQENQAGPTRRIPRKCSILSKTSHAYATVVDDEPCCFREAWQHGARTSSRAFRAQEQRSAEAHPLQYQREQQRTAQNLTGIILPRNGSVWRQQ